MPRFLAFWLLLAAILAAELEAILNLVHSNITQNALNQLKRITNLSSHFVYPVIIFISQDVSFFSHLSTFGGHTDRHLKF